MYAIIKKGSKQFRVTVGDVIDIDLLSDVSQGDKVEFGEVLYLFDGTKSRVGQPNIPNFAVVGEIVGEAKGKKVTGFKYKRSHNQQRKWGHRQKYTRVKITSIGKS